MVFVFYYIGFGLCRVGIRLKQGTLHSLYFASKKRRSKPITMKDFLRQVCISANKIDLMTMHTDML
ncbi:MAG: hypothetical protein B6I22_06115 [Desulfobacteraceae bacterium 4572_123]|nr:MAG: hypothetical protein B6I22_06115 [Desulfobacteraceae bacterium 4572_123]